MIATGAPKPASASSSAPKQNAIRIACVRWSDDNAPKLRCSTSKCPVATVMLKIHSAFTTIHMIGNSPKNAPCAAADSAIPTGIANPSTATSSAAASPDSAAHWARSRSAPSSTSTMASGSTETSADQPSEPPTACGFCWYGCARTVTVVIAAQCAPGTRDPQRESPGYSRAA